MKNGLWMKTAESVMATTVKYFWKGSNKRWYNTSYQYSNVQRYYYKYRKSVNHNRSYSYTWPNIMGVYFTNCCQLTTYNKGNMDILQNPSAWFPFLLKDQEGDPLLTCNRRTTTDREAFLLKRKTLSKKEKWKLPHSALGHFIQSTGNSRQLNKMKELRRCYSAIQKNNHSCHSVSNTKKFHRHLETMHKFSTLLFWTAVLFSLLSSCQAQEESSTFGKFIFWLY